MTEYLTGSEISHAELIRTWRDEPFVLHLYDLRRNGANDKALLGYEFFDEEFCPEPIFQGQDFGASPLHALDADETVVALLGFLAVRPGDTDAEYFADYTPAQLTWCHQRGEELGWRAEVLRQQGEWRELHESGQTERVVLEIARSGVREDLYEVLDLDIFTAYDLVEELALRTHDSALCRLLTELHHERNAELREN